jgi:hypothetical protein
MIVYKVFLIIYTILCRLVKPKTVGVIANVMKQSLKNKQIASLVPRSQ